MNGVKVSVPYEHESTDLSMIYLAVTEESRPRRNEWRPAFRDIERGGAKPTKVVFARFRPRKGRTVQVWIRDQDGDRRVHRQRL